MAAMPFIVVGGLVILILSILHNYGVLGASGYSNKTINIRSDLGLTKPSVYHDLEGATAIEYGISDRLAALKKLSTLKSGFEGLKTTRRVVDPWRKANPYTMMMR